MPEKKRKMYEKSEFLQRNGLFAASFLKNILFFGAFCLLLGLYALSQAAYSASDSDQGAKGPYLKHQIFADVKYARPGENITFLIRQDIHPGWHTYWKNPGDSGNPTTFDFKLPEGTEIKGPQFPAPKVIPGEELTTFGFENAAYYLFNVKLPDKLPEEILSAKVDIEALVCSDICIPEFETLNLDLPVKNSARKSASAHDGLFDTARSRLPEETDWKAFYGGDKKTLNIRLEIPPDQAGEMVMARNLFFFPHQWGVMDYKNPPVLMRTKENELLLRLKRDTRPLDQIEKLSGVLSFQFPEGPKAYAISASVDPEMMPEDEKAGAGSPASVDSPPQNQGLTESKGVNAADTTFLTAFVLAIFGGIILNLMPCVFPVLSMKALSLSRLGDKEQSEARAHGISYTAGILVMFAIIAALFLAVRSSGAEIGWGFQFQNPVIVLALACLLYLIGLNLAGFYDISGRFTGTGEYLTRKSGHTGSFMTGMLATIVATPCTAPFMGTALGVAIILPPVQGMMIFLALGLGLALPYLALCYIPALRAAMPRPGPWMDVFKQFLSFPMFASAIWLVWVYTIQTGAMGVLTALGVMIALTFSIWLFKTAPANKGTGRKIVLFLAWLVFLGSLVWGFAGYDMVADNSSSQQSTQTDTNGKDEITTNWPYSSDRLEKLLDGPDPVFVNMTAAWCITCKVNEKVALSSQSVREAFEQYNIRYLKGDWTNYDARITRYLEKFGRSGVPLYVYYGPRNEQSGKRPDPVVLPQILTPSLVIDKITPE